MSLNSGGSTFSPSTGTGLPFVTKQTHSGRLTSFRRSLLSLCRCHLMMACGERAWHSKKVLLPSTPYCTISRVFLLAAGTNRQTDRSGKTLSRQPQTVITLNSQQPKTSALANHHPAFQLPVRCRKTVITAIATNGGECQAQGADYGTRSLPLSSCLVAERRAR